MWELFRAYTTAPRRMYRKPCMRVKWVAAHCSKVSDTSLTVTGLIFEYFGSFIGRTAVGIRSKTSKMKGVCGGIWGWSEPPTIELERKGLGGVGIRGRFLLFLIVNNVRYPLPPPPNIFQRGKVYSISIIKLPIVCKF